MREKGYLSLVLEEGVTHVAKFNSRKAIINFSLVILFLIIALTPTPAVAAGSPFIGSGTPASPYLISSANDLQQLATLVNNGDTAYTAAYYQMENDIDISGIPNWTPIGIYTIHTNGFSGQFNGNGHYVSGMKITATTAGSNQYTSSYYGLFGYNSGTIKNLGVVNGNLNITAGTNTFCVGGIAGGNKGTINNCYNTCSITGSDGTAGNQAVVSGIASAIDGNGTITNCYNTGTIYGKREHIGSTYQTTVVGGISARAATISKCYNTGGVTGQYNVGGIAGSASGSSSSIENCYNMGSVRGDQYVGGIIGNLSGKISICYNTGWVTGTTAIGGIVGQASYPSQGSNCYFLDTSSSSGFGVGKKIDSPQVNVTTGSLTQTTMLQQTSYTTTYSGFDFTSTPTPVWYKSEGSYPKLRAQLLVPTGLKGVAPSVYGGSDGRITGATTAMQYKLSTASNYTTATGAEITGLTAGTYNVRYAATPEFNVGEIVNVVVADGPRSQSAPIGLMGEAPTLYGLSDGKITGTTAAMEYQLQGAGSYTAATETATTGLAAGTYNVRYAAKTGFNAGTDAVVIVAVGANANQGVPTEALTGVAPTSYGLSDGKITGTTTAMEYKLSTATDYTTVTGPEITGLATGTYNVRYAAKAGFNVGADAVVIVATGSNANQGVPTETLNGVAPTSYGLSDGKITGVNNRMEYRLGNTGAYTAVTGLATEVTGLAAGTYNVRYAAKAGFNAGADVEVVLTSGNKEQDAPTDLEGVAPTAYGLNDGRINGTTTLMEYQLQGAASYIAATATATTGLTAGTYEVRYAAKTGFNPGAAVTVTVPAGPNAEQLAPTGLNGVAPTTYGGNDGKITDTTAAMEYKLSTASNYIPVTNIVITGLAAGTYDVRYAAKAGFNAGATATVIVPAYTTPLTSVSISGTAQEGQTLTATVAPSGATVDYQWQANGTTVGTNANTYTVQTADMGKTITVSATGTDSYSGTVTSTPTDAVADVVITAKINNGSAIGGASLADVINKSSKAVNTITSIEITGGTVTTADWQYSSFLYVLTDLKVADTVSLVADIPDGDENNGGFLPRSLQTVEISKVTTIGQYAFAYCGDLKTVYFPKVTTIKDNAFKWCTGLITADFPLATSIGDNALLGGTSLTIADFPMAISIGKRAFESCTSLETVNFPLAINIGDYAFQNCAIKIADFPAVTNIGEYAFYRCASLTTANFPVATSIGYFGFVACTNLTTAEFPMATSIGGSAFANCPSLTSADFPAVTSIGEHAFRTCTSLTIADFPMATSIGKGAFDWCTSLITANFPRVTSIGDEAFYNCEKFTTLKLSTLPASVTNYDVFYKCPLPRNLVFVDAQGDNLTGEALTTAQSNYKAVSDGNTSDNFWYGWNIGKAYGPALTDVTNDDRLNTMIGMTAVMEFSTDGTTWTAYNATTPNLPDLTGTVALQVRVAETATHNAGAPTTFIFTVPTLTSIAITTPATKTVYEIGETLDITGMVVTGTYSDDTAIPETITVANVSGFNSDVAEVDQVLTITVNGKTTTYKVQINTPNEEQIAPTGLVGAAPSVYDRTDGKITGTTTAMEYKLSTDATYKPATESEITDLAAGIYEVRYAAKTGFNAGATATVTVPVGPNAEQLAPTGLGAAAPTTFNGNDGKITGATTAMEYKLSTDATYKPATESEITGLAAGTYEVRYAAKTGFNVGATVTVTVPTYKTPLTAVAISGSAKEGQILTATVVPGGATVDYQWQAGGVDVGTNSATYTVQAEDIGKTITVTVTATGSYTGTITSTPTSAVTAILITAKINNGSPIGGDSLADVFTKSGIELPAITSIEIIKGSVTSNDWHYMTIQFASLDGLTSFRVADTVTSVADLPTGWIPGDRVFRSSIQMVDIAKLTSITAGVFSSTPYDSYTALTTVNFPDVTSIGNQTFFGCTGLKTANFPKAETIGSNAFSNCSLETADFPATTSIGASAFFPIITLETANFPAATKIENSAFARCTSLTTANFPVATSIEGGAFYGCISLTTANFPMLTSIGTGAFYDCSELVILKLPALSPTVADVNAFEGGPLSRTLSFVDTNGIDLTGAALTAAQNNYKAVSDGDITDSLWYGWYITQADGPALTGVTSDDAANTMTGMTAAMEFSTDGITWTAYNADSPNLPDLTGTVALQVRVAETATHTAGAPTTFNFTVLVSIEITIPATKTAYYVGDELDISGMVVTGTYSDNSTKEETITYANVSGFDSSAVAANQTLTVTVGGKTITYTIAVAKADGPDLARVTSDDAANTMTGMTATMEFSTDGINWTAYNEESPNLPDLTGTVDLQVRVAETATHTAGAPTTFNFTAPSTYTLTVNLDGGNSGITGGNYIAGSEVAINAGTKAGYTFSGWTTSNGGTFADATLTTTIFTMPANEVTITAQWTENALTSVTISGTAEAGQTLTATVAPSNATVDYQWQAGGTAVGENAATYHVQAADIGKTITVTVTGIGSYSGTVTSAATSEVTGVPLTAVLISGTAKEGLILTATVAPSNATVDYQWQANGTAVGTNAATYTVQAEDIGKTITVTASGTGNYAGAITSNPTSAVTTPVITAKINDNSPIGGNSLADVVIKSGIALNTITSIEIIEGTVTTADWDYIKTIYSVVTLKVVDTVSTVAEIPDGTFSYMTSRALETVEIAKVTTIGRDMFNGDHQLASYTAKLKNVYFPNVTTIGSYAFYRNVYLTTVNIPAATSIGAYAFYLSGITTADFPAVASIGDSAFAHCYQLSSVNFPVATSIGNNGFRQPYALTTVNFPKVISIGDEAFSVSNNLKTANFPVATSIGVDAFNGSGLINANFPRVETIGAEAFNQADLTTANFPVATSMGESAFYECENLTNANFPVMTSIGNYAFRHNKAMVTLKLPATPPLGDPDVFTWPPTLKNLVFVDENGADLIGVHLTAAQKAYQAVNDGDTSDNLWYGWTIMPSLIPLTDVSIDGTAQEGQTLTAIVTPSGATATYQWTVGSTSIGTNVASYIVQRADIGKIITVTATGTGFYTGDLTSNPTSAVVRAADTYIVSFAGGTGATGIAPASEFKTANVKFTLPLNPYNKTMHTFTGWNDGTTTYSAGDLYTMPANDVSFTAQWRQLQKWSVVFNPQGGTSVSSVWVDEDGTAPRLPTTVREGYIFDGWYIDGTDTLFTCTTLVTDHMMILARWTPQAQAQTYTLTYDGNGATNGSVLSQLIKVGTPTPLHGNGFAKSGYIFTGWNTNADGSGTPYGIGDLISLTTANATAILYAQWATAPPQTYTVIFDGNGATSGSAATQTNTTGDSIHIPTNEFFLKGKTLTGWNTKADGSGTAYGKYDNVSAQPEGTIIVLYAQWIDNPPYKIIYDGNGATSGSVATQTTEAGTRTVISANEFTNPGYTFISWNTNAAGTGGNLPQGAWTELQPGSTMTLYAQWIANASNTYTVTFTGGTEATGTIPIQVATAENGTFALPANTFARTGYTFAAWSDGSATYNAGSTYTMPAKGVIFTAQWTENAPNTYNVTLRGGTGATGVVPIHAATAAGDTFALPANPFTRTGYTFTGWNDGTTTYSAGATYTMPANAVRFTAQWIENTATTYTVTFTGGTEATGEAPTQAATGANGTFALPANTFAKTGYTFAGWNDGRTTYDAGTTYTMPANAVTFTAQWTVDAADTYTVTFIGGAGATGVAPTQAATAENGTFQLPTNTFTKTGYTFAGWSDGSTTYDAGTTYTMPANAVTFTAQWTVDAPDTYTVTFKGGADATGEAPTQAATAENSTFVLPANPFAKTDYTFAGWNDGSTTYNAGTTYTMPAENVTFTAQWTVDAPDTYTVTFKGGAGATGVAPTQAATAENGTFVLPANTFTKTGYTFAGWNDGSTTYDAGTTYTMPANAVTFTAQWTVDAPDTYSVTFIGGAGATGVAPTQAVTAANGTFALPANTFAKTGYTFAGWNDGTTTYDAGITYTMPANAVTFTAQWTANAPDTYTVTFIGGTGATGVAPTQTVTAASIVVLPTNPFTKTGYTFAGWNDGTNNYGAGATYTMPAENVTFTAQWTVDAPDTYTVAFIGGTGTTGVAPTQAATAENGTFVLPANPFAKTGYTFAGWSDGSTTYNAGTTYTMPAENVTFTAQWIENTATTYAITFIGGTGATGTAPTQAATAEDAQFALPANPFTKAGYTFAGWNDGTTTYDAGTTYTMPAENVTFTAQWIENTATTYTVTFIGGTGATGEAPTQAATGAVVLPANPFVKTGYTFVGWNDGTTTYDAGTTYTMPANDVTFTAQWTANAPNTHTVSGTITDTDGNPVSGATISLTDTNDGSKTYTGTTDADGNYSIPGVPDGTYTITVTKGSETLGNGSIAVEGDDVTDESADITVTPPTISTHTVSGTITDTDGNPVSGATITLTDTNDSSKTYTGTTDADGNYSIPGVPDGTYTITVTKGSETLGIGSDDVIVDDGDVTGGSGNITVNPPTITTAQTPVFSASNVRGIEAVTKNAALTPLSVTAAVTDSGTLTYQWYQNATNSTTGGTPISGATSSSYTPPTDLVGTTYYYVEVTNTAIVGGETKTSTNTSSIKTVIVLAAPAPTYDVSASGSSLSNITLNNTIAKQYQNYTTTLSAASGYTLPSSLTITMGGVTLVPGVDYIYTKTSATTGTLTVYNVTGELSITAVGVLIPTQTYAITFNSSGGSTVAAISGTYGTALILPTPTKPDFNFAGWYRDSGFATSYLSNTMGAENITLHAKWEQITYEVTGNVKDEDDANVNSATVKLMAGSREVVQATTDANGVFTISGIPRGIYNLVISKGTDQIITLTITVSGNTTTGSVTLPKGNKNSVVEVKSGTPDIIVDKLNDFFTSNQFTQDDSNVIDAGGTVEIRLIIEQRVESGDNAAENAQSIIAAASGKEIGIFLNLSLSKIVTPILGGTAEQPIPIRELDDALIIDIPLPAELQGKSNYVVYRYHGTEVQTITQTNTDGEYIELSADGKSIKLHTKKFSTYAIGYTATSTPSKGGGGNGGGTSTAPTITTDSNTGGKVTISRDQKTATITPDEGYIIFDVLVDGKSVGAIATYTFTDSEKHTISAIFVEKTGVKRLAGVNRVDTALEIAKASYEGKVSNVVLATAENYPDALTGSVLAYKLKAPILLVGSTETDQEKVLDYLKKNLDSAGTVYILGGTAVVSSAMEAKVTILGFKNITRIAGEDRYETAIKIADQLVVKTGAPLVLVNGESYPDALSISSRAGIMQSPILLIQKDGISEEVKAKIVELQPSKVYIIGLEGVISSVAEREVAQITSLAQESIVRIGGTDRYETSLAVAQYFNSEGQTICVATGSNFPDALAGSVYAANVNAPIILVDGSLSEEQIYYLKTLKMTGATLFGGEAVVTKDIEEQLGQLINKYTSDK
ncbi:InlB B-repeat-containing protein [Desulfosporosinus sp.]|uniref:InlB B-repeat-containing protein n=1 Tax=Desulfosporosinus sp. TaxID=157907 RepID=UPI0025C403FA|nr:InlB B-repeat-containing protein [Desulfosporosinus sp.]MBC2727058.1 InlB B-repeat-containing protein [Desulfosporosinus sp.]